MSISFMPLHFESSEFFFQLFSPFPLNLHLKCIASLTIDIFRVLYCSISLWLSIIFVLPQCLFKKRAHTQYAVFTFGLCSISKKTAKKNKREKQIKKEEESGQIIYFCIFVSVCALPCNNDMRQRHNNQIGKSFAHMLKMKRNQHLTIHNRN